MKKLNNKKRNPIDKNKQGYCTTDEKIEAKIAENKAIKEARIKQAKFEKEGNYKIVKILRGVILQKIKE